MSSPIPPVAPVLTSIDSFTYVITPDGASAAINFGFQVSSDSILESLSYYSANSPSLILTLYAPASAPPAVLGAVQGATVVPQADSRFHFVLSPAGAAQKGAIGITRRADMRVNQVRLDVTLHTLDGSNFPVAAVGELTLQFRHRS